MNKFEQLIEYVINEDDAKAEDLFHEIVVEKSRDIYESLMDDEREFGGDKADELMNDISSDENGMREDDDEMNGDMDDMGGEEEMGDMDDMGGEEEVGGEEQEEADLEDRVVDLEDQLDALMAEFDSVIGDEGEMSGDVPGEMGIDGMDAANDMGDEEDMAMGMEGAFNEAVSLTKVTTGISNSTEAEGTNKSSVNADNSGKKGALAKPHQETGEESGRANPNVKPGNSTTEPNESKVAEPKKSGEDAGVNKKSLSGS